jgi:hypothetical protein
MHFNARVKTASNSPRAGPIRVPVPCAAGFRVETSPPRNLALQRSRVEIVGIRTCCSRAPLAGKFFVTVAENDFIMLPS